MSWEDVFKINEVYLDEKFHYVVMSRTILVTPVSNTVADHIRKFQIPLQIYPVTLVKDGPGRELKVKQSRSLGLCEKHAKEYSMTVATTQAHGNGGVYRNLNGGVVTAIEERHPKSYVMLEHFLRGNCYPIVQGNPGNNENPDPPVAGEDVQKESSSSNESDSRDSNATVGNEAAGASNNENDKDSGKGGCKVAQGSLQTRQYRTATVLPGNFGWHLPPGYIQERPMLAASIIQVPSANGIPFLSSPQVRMIAGMLINRFGHDFMLQKKFELVNMMTDTPQMWKHLRDNSRFMTDLMLAVFSDEMFNPLPNEYELV